MTRDTLMQTAATLMATFGRDASYTPEKAVQDAVRMGNELARLVPLTPREKRTDAMMDEFFADTVRKAGAA